MPDLCTATDVEVIQGHAIPSEDVDRVARLIEFASDLVSRACTLPLGAVPPTVAMVTASLVVRQMANPTSVVQEGVAGYWAMYGAGMELTDADLAALAPWLSASRGAAAYTVTTPKDPAVMYSPLWWQRDLDVYDPLYRVEVP